MPTFISHKFEDVAIYSAICLALDAGGVERWDPAKMTRGDSLADQLRDAIRECEVCIFLATRRSIDSAWCLAELGAFWGAGKRVLLFMADPDLTDAMLPPQFKGDLKVASAQELIDSVKATTEVHNKLLAEVTASAEITILDDRTHLYKKTAEILRGAKRMFLDTTWGPIAPHPSEAQEAALQDYLKERDNARERGVECRELFAGEGRAGRIATAKEQCKKGNLLIKVVDAGTELPYMPDIAVADGRHIVISNVGAQKAGQIRYMYIRSEGLAQLFHDWYWECWGKLNGIEIGIRPDIDANAANE